jgi:hypothetical protein
MKMAGRIIHADIPTKVKVEAFFHIGANFAYLLMVFLTILMPITLIIRYNHGYHKMALLDLPIFIFATISVFVFYFYTEYMVIKETLSVKHRSKAKPLVYLPFVVSVGIGLSINNSKSVVEALFKKQSPFYRTPKYNVADGEVRNFADHVRKVLSNVYRSRKIDCGEHCRVPARGVYDLCRILRLYKKPLSFAAAVMLFQFGFTYTSLLTILRRR